MVIIITALYACVGVFNAAFYVPQIRRAWSSRRYAMGVSVLSWCGWTVTSLIAVLFGWLVIHSWLVVAVGTVDFFGHILVAIPAVRARWQ